jgi:lactate dehydrogenase-like 2-hydroxyacid dehydrogenase
MTPRLLCASPLPPAVAQRASAEFGAILSQDKQMTIAEVLSVLGQQPELTAVLVSSRHRFDAAAIAALPPQVKVLATCSVGTEHIDLPAASGRGLIVTNTPDVLTNHECDCRSGFHAAAVREPPRQGVSADHGQWLATKPWLA